MRELLAYPVRNYQITVIFFVMLIALGVNSFLTIPRGEDPPLDFPGYTIIAAYPGAAPADMERLVVRPVEERLDELERVKEIQSRIVDGLATMFIEFEAGVDVDRKHDEVLRQVNAVRSMLPPDMARLDVIPATTLNVAIAQFALVSGILPYHEMDRIAEQFTDRLAAISGVRTAERWGAPARRVDVLVDLGRLAQLKLPPTLVLQAIGGESADLPAGAVEAGSRRFNVRASGSYESLEQIENTTVRALNGQLLRVGDVATAQWAYADSTHRARHNGERAVFVTVTQQAGQNIGAVRDRIWRTADVFEASLPAGVTLVRGFDQAENVAHRLNRLRDDFLIAIGLVALTLLPLGLRAAGIVMISIPLSLAIGISLMHATGFTINQLSIVGAVIALGLLVDDSIVVVENITRHLRLGYSRTEAAIRATQQIAVAVLGATATLIFAFVPLLLLPGGAGDYIRSLPAAVIYTVLASLLVSLTIIPWLASMVLPRKEREGGNRLLRALERGIHATYAPVLDRALRRPYATLGTAGAFVVGALALIPVVGFSLFPRAETPQFYVNITAPEGASIEATDAAVRHAEYVIGAQPQVRSVFASTGHDNPQVYYNIFPRRDDARVGQLFVTLDRYDRKRTPLMLDSLRTRLDAYPGARIEVREFENGPPIDAPVAFRVVGEDLDSLRAIAGRIEAAIAVTPGTQYVNNPLRLQRTDLRVAIDRQKAGLLNVQTAEIDRTLRLGLSGVTAGVLREASGDARDIVVRVNDAGRVSPATLERIHVASISGALTPLSQVAEVRFESGAPEIVRVDRQRSVTVSSSVRTGFNTERVTQAAVAGLDGVDMPQGYDLVVAGERESREESFSGVGSAVIIAMFMILAILVLEFRTFRSTLIVASVIPLGVVGGVIALLLSGHTLSFTAMIGFVALIGIEIKTSILLVDFTNQLRSQGVPLAEAIRKAGEVRFLPIVLTSLTAIGGLMPLALQGHGLYAPLAWVIIGGLVSSTLLARVVTPVLYGLLVPQVDLLAVDGPAAAVTVLP